jgi:hypothetical protein
MRLDQRPLAVDWRGVNIDNQLDCVRIAHANGGDGDFIVSEREHLQQVVGGTDKWNLIRGENRQTHVDGHRTIFLKSRNDHAAQGLDANLALVRQVLLMHETNKAACTVTALLDLAPIGIEIR